MVINPIMYQENGRANDIFSKNFESRVIHLVGQVTDELATSVVAQLLELDAVSHEDIYLYINSPGGSVSAGMAIVDTMQYIASDVVTIGLGIAASMGAVILASGEKGKRCVLPHSEVMIHQPSGGSEGMASDILIQADRIKQTRSTLNSVLAAATSSTVKKIEKDTDRDCWLDAKAAVEYGLVDKVLSKRSK